MDVDGVLVVRAQREAPWQRHEVVSSTGDLHVIWLNPLFGAWLTDLTEQFEPVWATGWQQDAPRLLEPLLRCPPAPVIQFTETPQPGVVIDKLSDVIAHIGERPAAWVDDHFGPAEHQWAASRDVPTLLLQPDPAVGLTSDHVARLRRFSGGLY